MKGLPLIPPFLLLVFSRDSVGQCPPNAQSKAMECIGRIGDMGMSANAKTVQRWDYQRTKIACEHGAFTDAIDCASNAIERCTASDLGVTLDIPLMRSAVTDMCNNVDAMRPYVDCMHNQLDGVIKCAEHQEKLLHAKIRAAGADTNKKMQSVCSFTNNVYGCQTNLVRQHCGAAPAKFLLDLMNAFRSPSCPPPDGIESSSQNLQISVACPILWTSLFVTLALSWT